MSFDWKQMVGSVAPVLGTALGGPFGGMAGKFIADALGTEVETLPDVVANANPETMLKIKNADIEFKIQMKELGIAEEQLHQKDRSGARNMAINTSIYPQVIQSVLYDAAFIMVCYFLFTAEIVYTDSQLALISYVMGILSAGLVQVNNFWFGSSSGSKEKTDIMGKK